jgi:hypothetical protein
MLRNGDLYARRTVLKTIGVTTAGSTAYTGAVGARRSDDLIEVDPTSLEREEGETGEVDVSVRGPPFGRTDVVVDGVPADPAEFRLAGRNATQTVELEAVEGTAEFRASTPRGDEEVVEVEVTLPDPLLDETGADALVSPVVELGEDHVEAQYNRLESLELTDPFTLAVEAPELAGQESTAYAVTAYYDAFGEAPNDRLSGPTFPLSFDEDGIASVTIGSVGTDADVTTWIAPGPLSEDATLVTQIEVPDGTERMAVETRSTADSTAGTTSVRTTTTDQGRFTEREEL